MYGVFGNYAPGVVLTVKLFVGPTLSRLHILLLFQKSCQVAAADWGARGGVLVPRVAAAPEDVSAVAEARVSNAGMADLAAAPRNIDTAQTPEQPQ